MSQSRFVDVREAEQTILAEGLRRYLREVSDHKKGAKQEALRIKRRIAQPASAKSMAAVRSSDMVEYRDYRIKDGASTATVRLDLAIIQRPLRHRLEGMGDRRIDQPMQELPNAKRQQGDNAFPGNGKQWGVSAELRRLRQQQAQVTMSAMFKKALAIFPQRLLCLTAETTFGERDGESASEQGDRHYPP